MRKDEDDEWEDDSVVQRGGACTGFTAVFWVILGDASAAVAVAELGRRQLAKRPMMKGW